MAAFGIIVATAVAVCGWIVTGVLSRRAVRRDMRVQYLMSAHRQLEAASNRPLTAQHERAIETAVSDVVLLGSADQVELAESFARASANEGTADTGPLLEELRTDLRKELMLGQAGPRKCGCESAPRAAGRSSLYEFGLAWT